MPSFEAIRETGRTDPTQAARFVSAMTLEQVRYAAEAIRRVAADPNSSDAIDMQVVSDDPANPIIDGVPQYQGPTGDNPNWRVAVQIELGDSSTTFLSALDDLEALEVTGDNNHSA